MSEVPVPDPALPPIEREIRVAWPPGEAFERFTARFAEWWPFRTHSIGGERVARIVFEARPGGLIFEEHRDGRRFGWGQVREWDPPRRVRFSWHPSRDPATHQDVEVRFEADGRGTRVVLVSWGWERWGPRARAARRGYRMGWGYVLQVWAGRRTPGMAVLDAIARVMTAVQALRGGREATIAKAGGELPRAGAEPSGTLRG